MWKLKHLMKLTLFASGTTLVGWRNKNFICPTLWLRTFRLGTTNLSRMAATRSTWIQIPCVIILQINWTNWATLATQNTFPKSIYLIRCSIVRACWPYFCYSRANGTTFTRNVFLKFRSTFQHRTSVASTNARSIHTRTNAALIGTELFPIGMETIPQYTIAGKMGDVSLVLAAWTTFAGRFDLFGQRTLQNGTGFFHAGQPLVWTGAA